MNARFLWTAAVCMLSACADQIPGNQSSSPTELRAGAIDLFPAPTEAVQAYHWATHAPLDGHAIRFMATVSVPADCTLTHTRSTMSSPPGVSFAYVLGSDGRRHSFGVSSGGEDLARLSAGAVGVDERVQTNSVGFMFIKTTHTFTADSSVEFLALASGLEASDHEASFAPGYSFAYTLACSAPFMIAVDQGVDAVIHGFGELEGDGVFSPVATAALVTGSATLRGYDAAYVVTHNADAEAGFLNVSHPAGMNSHLLSGGGIIHQSTGEGGHDFSIDRITGGLHFLMIAFYAFQGDMQLLPGPLNESAIN